MLTADVRFEGWTPADWSRFLALWKVEQRPKLDDEEQAPRGGLVLVHDGGRVRKALHTLTGRIEPSTLSYPRPLAELAAETHASWVWAFHTGALEELMERWGARIRRGDDALSQALLFFGAFRELLGEGAIDSWPRRLRNVPVPTRAVVDRAIDALVPAGKCVLVALYGEPGMPSGAASGELWTAIVLRRARDPVARFDVIAGPSELRREMGLLSGEFRRDYRHLVEAVETIYAPVAFGVHAEVDVFRKLITSAQAGDWARSVALRDIVVSPLPRVLALPLGVDATRGMVDFATKLARQADRLGIVQPLLRAVGERLPELPPTTRVSPGFDALEVLRRLLNR